MLILIDGYNFLDGAGILALGPGHYSLEKSRRAILRVLRARLTEAERLETTVVFDGTRAPRGLKRRDQQFGVTILYSRSGELADDLIEDLIARHTHPRRLTVVSSDHRIQRAARRRQARPVDSVQWYRSLLPAEDHEPSVAKEPGAWDPDQPPSTEGTQDTSGGSVSAWMKAFGPIDLDALRAEVAADQFQPTARAPASPDAEGAPDRAHDAPGQRGAPSDRGDSDSVKDVPFPEGHGEDILDKEEQAQDGWHPFPKGYGEDLLE